MTNQRDDNAFAELLGSLCEQYDLMIDFPHHDGFMKIYKHGDFIGEMNISGHNLLYCAYRLCEILKGELE